VLVAAGRVWAGEPTVGNPFSSNAVEWGLLVVVDAVSTGKPSLCTARRPEVVVANGRSCS